MKKIMVVFLFLWSAVCFGMDENAVVLQLGVKPHNKFMNDSEHYSTVLELQKALKCSNLTNNSFIQEQLLFESNQAQEFKDDSTCLQWIEDIHDSLKYIIFSSCSKIIREHVSNRIDAKKDN